MSRTLMRILTPLAYYLAEPRETAGDPAATDTASVCVIRSTQAQWAERVGHGISHILSVRKRTAPRGDKPRLEVTHCDSTPGSRIVPKPSAWAWRSVVQRIVCATPGRAGEGLPNPALPPRSSVRPGRTADRPSTTAARRRAPAPATLFTSCGLPPPSLPLARGEKT